MRDTAPCCVAITLGSLLHEINRYSQLSRFLGCVDLLLVDEAQQAGQAAHVAVHGAVPRTALTVHIGDDRQTRGASGNDPVRAEVLLRLGHKRVALHGLADLFVPHDFLALATEQLTGTRPGAAHPALLGLDYLAHAGTRLPPTAAFVRSANGLSSRGEPGLNLVLPSRVVRKEGL